MVLKQDKEGGFCKTRTVMMRAMMPSSCFVLSFSSLFSLFSQMSFLHTSGRQGAKPASPPLRLG